MKRQTKAKPNDGAPTLERIIFTKKVCSPLERKCKRAARKRNKIAAASRRKNR